MNYPRTRAFQIGVASLGFLLCSAPPIAGDYDFLGIDSYSQEGSRREAPRSTPVTRDTESAASEFQVPYDPTLPVKRVLVGTFRNGVPSLGQQLNVEVGLTTQLQTALSKCRNFQVVDREMVGELKNELVLSQSGAMTAESAPPAGKMLGAQVLIRGTVTEFSEQASGSSGGSRFSLGSMARVASVFSRDRSINRLADTTDALEIGQGSETVRGSVGLDLQLIDVSTGQLLQSMQVATTIQEERSASVLGIAGFSTQSEKFERTVIGKATRQAIEEAVVRIFNAMQRVPWQGMVAAVKPDGAVIINAGSSAHLSPGMELIVEAETAQVTDPATGLLLYSEKATIARLRITQVMDKVSFADLVEGADVRRGDVVKIAR